MPRLWHVYIRTTDAQDGRHYGSNINVKEYREYVSRIIDEEETNAGNAASAASERDRAESSKSLWSGPRVWLVTMLLVILLGVVGWYVLSGSSSPAPSDAFNATATSQQVQATSVALNRSTLNSNVAATATAQATQNWRLLQTFTGKNTNNSTQKRRCFRCRTTGSSPGPVRVKMVWMIGCMSQSIIAMGLSMMLGHR